MEKKVMVTKEFLERSQNKKDMQKIIIENAIFDIIRQVPIEELKGLFNISIVGNKTMKEISKLPLDEREYEIMMTQKGLVEYTVETKF